MTICRLLQTCQIHALYTLARYRRRGIGTALLRAALIGGNGMAVAAAQLSVLPHNPPGGCSAIGFQHLWP